MTGLIFFAIAVCVALPVAMWLGSRPTDLNPEIWDADPDKRRENLRQARAAWWRGETYVNPERERARQAVGPTAIGPGVVSGPNGPIRRLVQPTKMHRPKWSS